MAKAQAPVHTANVQISSVTFRPGPLSTPFFFLIIIFSPSPTAKEHCLVAAFNYRFKNGLFHVFRHLWHLAYSSLKSGSQYITYWTKRLVWNRMKLVYVWLLQCSIMFDCLSVRFRNVRLCSIGNIFGWVRLSSITETNRSQSNDWSSITESSSDYAGHLPFRIFLLFLRLKTKSSNGEYDGYRSYAAKGVICHPWYYN